MSEFYEYSKRLVHIQNEIDAMRHKLVEASNLCKENLSFQDASKDALRYKYLKSTIGIPKEGDMWVVRRNYGHFIFDMSAVENKDLDILIDIEIAKIKGGLK